MKRWCKNPDGPQNASGESASAGKVAGLTSREREIAQRIALGQTTADISAALKIARGTIRNHVSAIHAKLGVRTRAEIAAWAWRSGLVQA